MRCAAQLSAAGRVWPAVAAYLWLRFRRGFRSAHRPEPPRPLIYLHAECHARPTAGRLRWPRPPCPLDERATRNDDCHRIRQPLAIASARKETGNDNDDDNDDGDDDDDLRRLCGRCSLGPIGRGTVIFYS